jgi:hypothetical protein
MNQDRRPAGTAGAPGGYTRHLVIKAPAEDVFDAIATVDGPRHWWTTKVTGSAAVGSELCFGFAGLDEQMIMRVSASQWPSAVRWLCVEHTRNGGVDRHATRVRTRRLRSAGV